MKNSDRWKPSKYIYRHGTLAGSRNSAEVGTGSRLMTDLIARQYEVHLPEHAKGRLLDLGCGKVPLFQAYRRLVSDNICVDWQNTLHKNEYLDHECDLTQALPLGDRSFDTIILSDVLEHLPEPQRLWSEMARLLRPRGRLVMNVPFYYWLHEQPHDYFRYTEFALRRFVETAGLCVVDLHPIGGAPEIIADIIAKNLVRVRLVGAPLAMFTQWLACAFVGTRLGAKVSRSTSYSFPFGYFLVAEKGDV